MVALLVKSQVRLSSRISRKRILHNADFLRDAAKNLISSITKFYKELGCFARIICILMRKKNKILWLFKILALPLLKDLRCNIHCKKRVLFQIT